MSKNPKKYQKMTKNTKKHQKIPKIPKKYKKKTQKAARPYSIKFGLWGEGEDISGLASPQVGAKKRKKKRLKKII